MRTPATPWLTVLAVVLLAAGCKAAQDEIAPNQYTLLQGQFTTAGGTQPVANVPLEVVYYQSPAFSFFGGFERSKKQGATDAQGRYDLRVLLDENELTSGDLLIRYAVDSSKYYLLYPPAPTLSPDFGGSPRRNTTIITDGRVPRKAWVKLQVQANPNPGDYFTSYFQFPGEFSVRSRHVNLLSTPAGSRLQVPGDVPLVVLTTKIRGGVQSQVVDTLRVLGGQTLTYSPHF